MTKSADAVKLGNSVSRLRRRPRTDRRRTGKAIRVTESVLLVATATLMLLALGEFGIRIATHAPLFEWRDFRHGRATGTINKAIQYDSQLGWHLKPFLVNDGFKQFLGHFAAIDRFMAAFFANFWFTSDGNNFLTVSTDEVGVTCRLLARLKQKTDAANVRLILYLQYPGMEIVDGSRVAAGGLYAAQRWVKNKLRPLLLGTPPGAPDWHEASALVGQCARDLQIATVDEYPILRSLYETNADEWRTYYQLKDGALVHKSSLGNKEVAQLVAAAIGDLAASPIQQLK
jgi:hypothetical protein